MRGPENRHNWPELKRRWLSGEFVTLKEMSKKTGLSISTLSKRAAKDGWRNKKISVEAKAETKIEEKIIAITASRYSKIIERHLKYADILLGLGFNSFKGKTKISNESNALSSIRLGLETQRRAVRGFQPDDEETAETINSGNQIINQQINIYQNIDPESRMNQIAKTIEILAEEAKVLPKPKQGKGNKDGE